MYHIFTLPRRFGHAPKAIMPPQDLAIQRDIDRVVQTLNCQDLYSRHYQRNLQNAVRRCRNPGQTRSYIISTWTQIASISLGSFILFTFSCEESLDEVDALFVPASPASPVQPILDHGLQVINRASLGAWKLESLTQISSPRTT
jgi:hypothetical protein